MNCHSDRLLSLRNPDPQSRVWATPPHFEKTGKQNQVYCRSRYDDGVTPVADRNARVKALWS